VVRTFDAEEYYYMVWLLIACRERPTPCFLNAEAQTKLKHLLRVRPQYIK